MYMKLLKKQPIKEPTLNDLIQARNKCAEIIAKYGTKYLPIFERLELEIELAEKRERALKKALLIATQNGTCIGTQNENLSTEQF